MAQNTVMVTALHGNGVRRSRACPHYCCLGACASNRTPERSFTTLVEAKAGGAFENGVAARVRVPPSAKNIRVRRDTGSTELWARFEFDEVDRAALGAGCQRIGQQELRLPASRDPRHRLVARDAAKRSRRGRAAVRVAPVQRPGPAAWRGSPSTGR